MENEVLEQEAPIETEVIASVGSTQRATPIVQKQVEAEVEGTVEAVAEEIKEEVPPIQTAELTDDELKELFKKRFPTSTEKTQEEKQAEESAFEKRMLDIYLEQGGKIEDFGKLKEFATVDLKELSKQAIVKNLKDKGFNEDEINEVLVEQYYQINPDELEIGDEETDEEFAARKAKVVKKVAYGNAKFESKGQRVKEKAEATFNILRSEIEKRDFEAKQEADFIAKVEALPSTLPKSITLSLGKLNDKDLGSVKVDVNAEDIEEIVNTLKDSVKRKQLLFNEDNSINEKSLADLMLRNKLLEKAARESLFEGQTRGANIAAQVFPARSPNALGLGGTPFSKDTTGKEQVAGFGQTQRVRVAR